MQEFLSNAKVTVNGHVDAFKLSTLTWMRLDHPSRKETYVVGDKIEICILLWASRSISHIVVQFWGNDKILLKWLCYGNRKLAIIRRLSDWITTSSLKKFQSPAQYDNHNLVLRFQNIWAKQQPGFPKLHIFWYFNPVWMNNAILRLST